MDIVRITTAARRVMFAMVLGPGMRNMRGP
jgi:hypothetical protein